MMSTMIEMATPAAVMNGTPATARPRIAITTVPPAKTTACPAVATARPTDSSTEKLASEELAVAGDDEQGIVDADAEADHRPDVGHPRRDLDQIRDERHRADSEGEAEDRQTDRQPHRDHRAECEEEDDDRGNDADHLGARLGFVEGEEQVASGFHLQDASVAGCVDGCFEAIEVGCGQRVEHRVLHLHQHHRAVG